VRREGRLRGFFGVVMGFDEPWLGFLGVRGARAGFAGDGLAVVVVVEGLGVALDLDSDDVVARVYDGEAISKLDSFLYISIGYYFGIVGVDIYVGYSV